MLMGTSGGGLSHAKVSLPWALVMDFLASSLLQASSLLTLDSGVWAESRWASRQGAPRHTWRVGHTLEVGHVVMGYTLEVGHVVSH